MKGERAGRDREGRRAILPKGLADVQTQGAGSAKALWLAGMLGACTAAGGGLQEPEASSEFRIGQKNSSAVLLGADSWPIGKGPLRAMTFSTTTAVCALLPLFCLTLTAPGAMPPPDAAQAVQDPVRRRPASRDPKRTPVQDVENLNQTIVALKARIQAREDRNVTGQTTFVDADQIVEWFTICDHNSNSWLSFSETSRSLHFSRERFQAFDEDRDGRLAQAEFEEFYRYSILGGRKFAPPTPIKREPKPPRRSAIQLRNAYDTDLDGALSSSELTRLLVDYGRESADVESVIQSLDRSGEGLLSTAELSALPTVLHPVEVGDGPRRPLPPGVPTSLLELFGTPMERGGGTGFTPLPPLIVGPVPHFRRLDVDDDGFITVDDLERLLRPLRVSVRPHTVINTLDTNGDFRLSPEEFYRALGGIDK